MGTLFFTLLDLSIAALPPILIVTLLRGTLRKIPHSVWCILWGLVALRLLIPFSIESIFSLVPKTAPVVQQIYNAGDAVYASNLPIPDGVKIIIADAEALEIGIVLFGLLIPFGTLAMLLPAIIRTLRISMKVKEAVLLQDNVYLCDHIDSSFILPGIPNPRILLPSSMDEGERIYVIAHEKAHIQRLDHIWKPLAYFILSIYWWNPTVWLSYILFCRDIEFACDEKVLRNQNTAWKKPYSTALLNQSIPHASVMSYSLAFGEVSVKSRIRNILRYQKPTAWISAGALLCGILVIVCFFTSPIGTAVDEQADIALSKAILAQQSATLDEGNLPAETHTVLGFEQSGRITTVYAMVMYQEYSYTDGEIAIDAYHHSPAIITLELRENGEYALLSYHSIEKITDEDRSNFPWYLQGKLDTQNYVKEHTEACNRKAAEHFGIEYERAFP